MNINEYPKKSAVPPPKEISEEQKQETKILMYLIGALSFTGNFISRVFMGLYAVFINSSASAISLITSLRNLIQQIFQFTFGRISDRIGRKIMMIIGLLLSAVLIGLFPLVQNQWLLVAAVVCFSIGYSIYYPTFTALQGDISNRKNRAGIISFFTIIGAFATMIGLVVVGFIGNTGKTDWNQYLIIFEITAGIFLLGAIISVFLVDPPREKLEEKIPFSFNPIIQNKQFRRFVIINSFMAFCMSLGWPIFPYVREEFATPQQNTWIWGFFCLFQIIALLATRKIINKMNRKILLYFGRLLIFYVPLNLTITTHWVQTWWHLAISGAVSGACNAFYFVGLNTYILDSATEKEMGTYTGVSNFFIGITTFIGSLVMGLIADALMSTFGKWFIIELLLYIIAGIRLFAAQLFLLLEEPKQTKLSTEKE